MSREQIEEMARITAKAIEEKVCTKCEDCKWRGLEIEDVDCTDLVCAEALYNAGYRKQEWISVEERLPTEEENDRGLVGFVNGYNGKIRFTDAIIFVDYDFDEKEWWSQDYALTDCKVECWMPLPEAPKMKGVKELNNG